MNNKALELINVSKNYKEEYELKNISLSINEGEFHALIGRNGAGKTTIIKLILGITSLTMGTILINGKDNKDEKAKLSIGYVPDKINFPSFTTVNNALIDMCYLSGEGRDVCKEKAKALLEKHDFSEHANRKIKNLSMGQQKKVLFLQAIIHNPSILILDEPTTNLDPIGEVHFFEMISKLNKEGVTILLVSHKLALVEKYASHITLLDKGELKYNGAISDFNKKDKSLLDTVVIKVGGEDE